MKILILKDNFPIDGEMYVAGKQNGRYFFAWGDNIPYKEKMPKNNIGDGASGIEWYETEVEALHAYIESIESCYEVFGRSSFGIENYMSPNEAAYRWGINQETVKNKLKPSLNKKEIDEMEKKGLIKSFVRPGGKRREWIITSDAMKHWFGERE